jgi:hypothetical protein
MNSLLGVVLDHDCGLSLRANATAAPSVYTTSDGTDKEKISGITKKAS